MRDLFSDNIFLIPVSGKRDQIIFIYALLQVSHPGPNDSLPLIEAPSIIFQTAKHQ
jgi:hypothetical protein